MTTQGFSLPASLVIMMSAWLAVPAQAEPTEPRSGTGMSIIFGVDAGYALTEPGDADRESAKAGSHLTGKALFSLFTDAMALDVGAGWLNSELSGDPAPRVDDSKEADHRLVHTQAGYAEFAGRYRLGENWEIGGIGQVLFGTDASFAPFEEDDKTPTVLVGPQLVYSIRERNRLDNRFAVQFLTDVTIEERQFYLLSVGVGLGVPLVRPDVDVKYRVKVKEKAVVEYRERLEVRDRYLLEPEYFNFVTDRYELDQKSTAFLTELGRFLAENPAVWERLIISGHTDVRGSLEHNRELATNRARAVADVLIDQGLPEERLKILVYGPQDPIDEAGSSVALARNRRVEVAFDGQTDVTRIRTFISRLKQRLDLPATCQGEDCR